MSLSTTVTGNGTTTTVSPVAANSDIIVEGKASLEGGVVVLEVKIPGTTVYVPVASQTGSYVIATPDQNLEYRFRAINCTETVNVYFGP